MFVFVKSTPFFILILCSHTGFSKMAMSYLTRALSKSKFQLQPHQWCHHRQNPPPPHRAKGGGVGFTLLDGHWLRPRLLQRRKYHHQGFIVSTIIILISFLKLKVARGVQYFGTVGPDNLFRWGCNWGLLHDLRGRARGARIRSWRVYEGLNASGGLRPSVYTGLNVWQKYRNGPTESRNQSFKLHFRC